MTDAVWCFTQVLGIAKAELGSANKMFLKMPTATNWVRVQRAMVLWQQLDAVRGPKVSVWNQHKANDITVALLDKPVCEWSDIVCMAVLGITAREALA